MSTNSVSFRGAPTKKSTRWNEHELARWHDGWNESNKRRNESRTASEAMPATKERTHQPERARASAVARRVDRVRQEATGVKNGERSDAGNKRKNPPARTSTSVRGGTTGGASLTRGEGGRPGEQSDAGQGLGVVCPFSGGR